MSATATDEMLAFFFVCLHRRDLKKFRTTRLFINFVYEIYAVLFFFISFANVNMYGGEKANVGQIKCETVLLIAFVVTPKLIETSRRF